MENRIKALAQLLDCKKSEITQSNYDENTFEYGSEEYLVVTDEEADELWEQDLDNYLEECIYPLLPDNMVNYFDDEKWKRDARYDGRGHSLNRYDGAEYIEEVKAKDGEVIETYYIFRQN